MFFPVFLFRQGGKLSKKDLGSNPIAERMFQNHVTNYLLNRGPSLPVSINEYKIIVTLKVYDRATFAFLAK
jgi:hypothetical protein